MLSFFSLRQFGKVDLRGRKTLTVFVRNLSAIATPFSVKIRKHSCTPCPPRLKISNMSYSALQRVVSNPRALSAYLDNDAVDDEGENDAHNHGKGEDESLDRWTIYLIVRGGGSRGIRRC